MLEVDETLFCKGDITAGLRPQEGSCGRLEDLASVTCNGVCCSGKEGGCPARLSKKQLVTTARWWRLVEVGMPSFTDRSDQVVQGTSFSVSGYPFNRFRLVRLRCPLNLLLLAD